MSGLPFSGLSSESDIAEWEDMQLLARNVCILIAFPIFADIATEPKYILIKNLFAEHGTYNKAQAVKFVKNIPSKSLQSLKDSVHTIHSVSKNGEVAKNQKPKDGVSNAFPLPYPSHLLFC